LSVILINNIWYVNSICRLYSKYIHI
jgi:hypothetical protein